MSLWASVVGPGLDVTCLTLVGRVDDQIRTERAQRFDLVVAPGRRRDPRAQRLGNLDGERPGPRRIHPPMLLPSDRPLHS